MGMGVLYGLCTLGIQKNFVELNPTRDEKLIHVTSIYHLTMPESEVKVSIDSGKRRRIVKLELMM